MENVIADPVKSREGAALPNLRIGMVAPVAIDDFRTYLPSCEALPKGLGSPAMGIYARELLERGHYLTIFTLDPEITTERVVEGDKLKICIGPYTPVRRRALSFFRAERDYLERAIRREKPALLHAHWTYEFALAAIASEIPHVITAHDAPWQVLRYDHRPYRILRTVMAYMAGRKAHKIVAVSPYVAEHLNRFLIHGKPVEVIPNGMPDGRFADIHKRNPNAPLTMVTAMMGWSGRKNGEIAIEAFAKVRERIPDVRLIMFGSQHGADEPAAAWARARGLEAGIEFAGHLPSHADLLKRLLAEADIFVHPALEEAHPMSLVEAMSMGIPIIGGETSGGVPWTLGQGKYGVLVNMRSAEALTGAILRLAENEDERVRIGMAGYEAAKSQYHIARVIDRYEAIYSDLVR
jgi:glycosyltransferase involved in cell wall biosynthesis